MWIKQGHIWLLPLWRTQVQISTQTWIHNSSSCFCFPFAGLYKQLEAEVCIHLLSKTVNCSLATIVVILQNKFFTSLAYLNTFLFWFALSPASYPFSSNANALRAFRSYINSLLLAGYQTCTLMSLFTLMIGTNCKSLLAHIKYI